MKRTEFVIAAAMIAGLSCPAFAQQGSAPPATTNPPANQGIANTSDNLRSWMVSGFLGTNFGSSRKDSADLENFDTSSTSANFGGQLAYLGRGVIGGEFLADFSPGLNTFDNVLFDRSPNVNSYMFNLIAVAPFGHAHSYNPYISGGVGAVTLRSTI